MISEVFYYPFYIYQSVCYLLPFMQYHSTPLLYRSPVIVLDLTVSSYYRRNFVKGLGRIHVKL